MAPLTRIECAPYPLDAQVIDGRQQRCVESAREIRVGAARPGKPTSRGEDDTLLFRGRDARGRATEAGVAAQTDFDERDRAAVKADEIHLAAAAAHVASEDDHAVTTEKALGSRLGRAAARLRRPRPAADNRFPVFAPGCPMSHHPSSLSSTPSLYVVATPLGNLQDISMRAQAVLAGVDAIAAEDTRHSQRLLDALGIGTRLFPLHEHNEQAAVGQVIRMLEDGKHVALISDAGTPAISDPGARAVTRVREAGFPVVPVPGACAAIAALSASGFVDSGFHFVGFLPTRQAARRGAIEALRDVAVPLVFYESPHRIAECVTDLAAVLEPVREIVIARELTKLYEQIVRLPLAEAGAWLAEDPNRCRGEFVLIVSGAPEAQGLDAQAEKVLALLVAELPVKVAARLAAEITGAPKNALYARALELRAG